MNLKKNPELIPLIDWWEKDGKSTVLWLVVAAVVIGGWYGWKGYKAAAKESAAATIAAATTMEDLEEAVSKYEGSNTALVLKMRLAKSYFDSARYEEALAQYEALISSAPDGFGDIPVVGRAQCLEALKRFGEAQAAFEAFAKANPKHYLTLTAELGAARSLAQAGEKDKALERLKALKEANAGDSFAKTRIEDTESVIRRAL